MQLNLNSVLRLYYATESELCSQAILSESGLRLCYATESKLCSQAILCN